MEKFLNLLADVIAEEVIRDHRAAQKSTEVAAPLQKPLMSRLLDLPRAAAYLGISPWTLRELPLPRVRLEPPSGKALRKILYDRQDLDAWIDRHKDLPMDR